VINGFRDPVVIFSILLKALRVEGISFKATGLTASEGPNPTRMIGYVRPF
jgi:hypothetical protein